MNRQYLQHHIFNNLVVKFKLDSLYIKILLHCQCLDVASDLLYGHIRSYQELIHRYAYS
jgi:hypothetical protein